MNEKENTDLTIKQKMVLECIEWFIDEHGYSPTYQELAELLHSHPDNVFKKVLILIDKGYLVSENSKARSIRVIKHVECE